MITGQGNGQGGREHGQKCDQLPGQRMLTDPAAREHVAKVWGISPDELPQPGTAPRKSWRRFIAAKSKRCSAVLQSARFAARCKLHTGSADKLEFFGVIDFFFSETAHHADVVLAGSLQEEEEGSSCNVEGRVIHIQKAVDPPANARTDTCDPM